VCFFGKYVTYLGNDMEINDHPVPAYHYPLMGTNPVIFCYANGKIHFMCSFYQVSGSNKARSSNFYRYGLLLLLLHLQYRGRFI